MSLGLIIGPPSSGRTGALLRRVEAWATAAPLVVVPTSDDVERVETELARRDAALGVTVTTFAGLEAELARRLGGSRARSAGAVERRQILRRAIRETRLGPLAASAERPGFLAEVDRLMLELARAGTGARELAARAPGSEQPGVLGDLARIAFALAEGLDRAGLAGPRERIARALERLQLDASAWGGRPVALLGFDDLDPLQIDLLTALAEASEVIVSLTYEDRVAGRARARLLGELLERGAGVLAELEADPDNTSSPALHHLERGFAEPATRAPCDPGVGFLLAAGRRGAIELAGAEVAREIADGEDPGEIAIVLRDPGRHAALWESVFERFGVGAAIEADVGFESTATGRGLCSLLRAANGGAASDLIGFLRAPGVAPRGAVDRLERQVRRLGTESAAEAEELWDGRELFELGDLRESIAADDGVALLRALSRAARGLAERPRRREARSSGRRLELELRAGELAVGLLDELVGVAVALGDTGAELAADALAELEAAQLPLHRGSSERAVRITDPYRVRARRVRTLVVADLEEGDFPRASSPDPLLGDASRALCGLPPRAERLDEERYLFWSCLSRASHRIRFSWRVADDEGVAVNRSPFADEVLALLDGGEAVLGSAARRRDLAEVSFEPDEAPGPDELARSLATRHLEPATGSELALRLARARAARERDVKHDVAPSEALEELAARRLFGASTLEDYATCSFRWFVGHELRPRDLEPDPEPLVQGSLVHGVLERLYREPPAGAAPRSDTVGAWVARARELTLELAAGFGLAGEDVRGRVSRARTLALVVNALRNEAANPSPLRPDPELIEAAFGEGPGDARPPLELDGLTLHGKIDRVDRAADGSGLVRDYKTGAKVAGRAQIEDDGKLQLQLYSLALERLWDIAPLGGVYEPLAATGDRRPRGIVAGGDAEPATDGLALVSTDVIDPAELRDLLAAAEREAAGVVAGMRSGRVRPEPRHDTCPSYCEHAPICRRQRARIAELIDEDPDEPRQERAF
ncbi:hypothetical protein HJD18_04965 [Thermoleophilia bacterium SCSIO 60948]|nr:hypothetical protein HJD18_04965 [Thermoleophilia bacterium SCSIO 60948]